MTGNSGKQFAQRPLALVIELVAAQQTVGLSRRSGNGLLKSCFFGVWFRREQFAYAAEEKKEKVVSAGHGLHFQLKLDRGVELSHPLSGLFCQIFLRGYTPIFQATAEQCGVNKNA